MTNFFHGWTCDERNVVKLVGVDCCRVFTHKFKTLLYQLCCATVLRKSSFKLAPLLQCGKQLNLCARGQKQILNICLRYGSLEQ